MTSAEPSQLTRLPDTVDAQVLDTLNAFAAGRSIDLAVAPNALQCERILSSVPAMLRDWMPWEHAASQATRLASVLPAAKSDDMDKALAIQEMAKAFAAYPPAIANWAADALMASSRFRPVPAEIHSAAKGRQTQLRAAVVMAERVNEARVAAAAERQRMVAEAEEEARAIAEGRETPSERRTRIANEARALIPNLRMPGAAA